MYQKRNPQMPKELEIDCEPLMTYTANVYIKKELYGTDPNLFDRGGEGAAGNYRPDTRR
jgi:hypothetical protein